MRQLVLALVLVTQNASQAVQYGSVSGRIAAAGGAPAANVRVAVIVAGDTQQPADVAMMSLTETDSAGRYRLENVPPGRYYLIVGPVDAPLYFPGVSARSSASVVTVSPGAALTNVDFAVERTIAQLQAPPPRQAAAALAARGARGSPAQFQLLVFDRQGKQVGVLPELIPSGVISLSPDGKRVAIARNGDIWTLDVDTGKATQITSDPAPDANPAWSPDGRRIAYFSNRSPAGVYVRSADGTGAEELLYGQVGIGLAWSTDRYLSMVIGTDVWALPTTGERKPMQILRSNAIGPRFSLDGRFVAYSFNRTEIFVRPFDGAAADPTPVDKEKRISVQGGVGLARWRADGAELYYLAANGGVMVAPISSAPEFIAGTPTLLFQAPSNFSRTGNPGQLSDISADGQRFVFLVPVPAAARPAVTPPVVAPCQSLTLAFRAEPDVVGSGQSTRLIWDAPNAASVTIDPGIGQVSATGSREVQPQASIIYTARATAPSCPAASAVAVVTVRPAP